MPDSNLCIRCQRLSFDAKDAKATPAKPPPAEIKNYRVILLDYTVQDDFPRLPKLRSSAKDGCQMCQLLKDIIWSHVRSSPELLKTANQAMTKDRQDPGCPNLGIRIELYECHPHLGRFRLGEEDEEWTPASITGRIEVGEHEDELRINVRNEVFGLFNAFPEPDPLSEKSVQLIKQWLADCSDPDNAVHKWCPKVEITPAPLRVLDVMQGDTVRLVETEGTQVRYAILSYCWGTSPIVSASRTVPSNISLRMSGFPLKSLPQTIQDTIAVVRRLGISYVWIDALCIVQDSDEWMTESTRMMQYYQNACLTIIPVMCSSADQGFLQQRPWWVMQNIQWPCLGGKMQFYYPEYQVFYIEISSSVWDSRGWTFQERLLSRRSLFIGRSGMRFECRGGDASDVSRSSFGTNPSISNFLPISPSQTNYSQEWNNVDMIRSKWYQLVEQFAGRKLTFESDKLIALSGVAAKFGEIFQGADTYMDGFWESDWCNGLQWRLSPQAARKAASLTKSPCFPSWSWCSTNITLSWKDGSGSVPCAELVKLARPTTKDKVDGGATGTSLLTMRSWVFDLELLETELPDGLETETRFDDGSDLDGDVQFPKGLKALVLTVYLHGEDEDAWREAPATAPHDISGLIICAAGNEDGVDDVYRRVGVFDVMRELESRLTEESVDKHDFFQIPVPIDDFEETSGAEIFESIYAEKRTVVLV